MGLAPSRMHMAPMRERSGCQAMESAPTPPARAQNMPKIIPRKTCAGRPGGRILANAEMITLPVSHLRARVLPPDWCSSQQPTSNGLKDARSERRT
jgi:hypothetical protein